MENQPVSREEMNEIAASLSKSISDTAQSMIREVYTVIGAANAKFESVIRQQEEIKESITSIGNKFDEKFEDLNERVSKNEEQIQQLNRLMFGDARTASAPFIRKDIDRHESELIGLNQTVREINTDIGLLRKKFEEFLTKFDLFLGRYAVDMKAVMALTAITKKVYPSLKIALKILIGQRWTYILPAAGTIGVVISAAIEYLKALGLIK